MTMGKGLSILSVICLKIISCFLTAIFQNSCMIQRCLNKMFQRSNHCLNRYLNICSWEKMSERKFFSLAWKVKIVNYAKKNPHLSSRKLEDEFGCGKTCIQTLIKQKKVILTDSKCHENYFLKKKGRSEEFQDVNSAVWRWFCMAREALTAASGSMTQAEAL